MRERLYRSRSDRMLFGVAGGMADWMDLDPAIVRIVWALLILAGGVGLILYIVAAIVIPEAPPGYAPGVGPADASTAAAGALDTTGAQAARRNRGSGVGAAIFGLVLVVAGAWILIDRYIDIDTSWLMPGALIVIGIVLVFGALGRSRSSDG